MRSSRPGIDQRRRAPNDCSCRPAARAYSLYGVPIRTGPYTTLRGPSARISLSTRRTAFCRTVGTASTIAADRAGRSSLAMRYVTAPPTSAPASVRASTRAADRAEKSATAPRRTSGTMKKSVASANPQRKPSRPVAGEAARSRKPSYLVSATLTRTSIASPGGQTAHGPTVLSDAPARNRTRARGLGNRCSIH